MRTNLKVFRIKQGLSQVEISSKIGCNRATYSAIENGTRDGTFKFWNKLQQAFELPNCDMWELIRND